MQANPLSEISLIRRLKLNQLMIFERVLETRSVVRAANEMRLTQPAVTKVIHELESCFDGALFSRSNRGVVPTELGLMLGRRVKSLMAELRYMTDELNDFRLGTSGHVIVGTLISASARLLPRAIAMVKSRTPNVLVTVREGTTAHLFPALATGDLDIVVGRLPERELPIASAFPLTHEALFDESLCAVVGKGYGALPECVAHLSELAGSPWILPIALDFADTGLPGAAGGGASVPLRRPAAADRYCRVALAADQHWPAAGDAAHCADAARGSKAVCRCWVGEHS